MNVGVVLDVIVIALLIGGALGGLLINRRLSRLVAAQRELKGALEGFDAAASRADAALRGLEAGGLAKGAELQSAAARAQALLNELAVMTSAGERIADRIENIVKDVRSLGAARAAGKPKRAA